MPCELGQGARGCHATLTYIGALQRPGPRVPGLLRGAPPERHIAPGVPHSWPGDPRVNIQDDHGMAKPYQVRQVLAASKKLEEGLVNAAEHYTYRVAWSAGDGAFVGTVAELPSLSWLAPTRAEAFEGIQRLADEVVHDLEASGEPGPDALSDRNFSGRFVVRVPAEVRPQLVRDAAEQHVSLNRLVSSRLMGP